MNIRETNCTILWTEIYPVDSVIHRSDNWGQVSVAVLPETEHFSLHPYLHLLIINDSPDFSQSGKSGNSAKWMESPIFSQGQ